MFFGLILFNSVLSFSQSKVLLDTTFSVSQTSDEGTVYLYNYSASKYKSVFLDKLSQAFHEQKNQLVFNSKDGTKPYYLNIAKLKLSEKINSETVDDTASEQYGQSYELSTCEVKVEYVLSTPDHQTVKDWKTLSIKGETLSNNRSFFEWLFGLNKHNTECHEKKLDNDIFFTLIENICTRIAKKTSKKIKKAKKRENSS